MPVLGHLLLAFAVLANALGLQAMGHAHSTMPPAIEAPAVEARMASMTPGAPMEHGDCHGQAADDAATALPTDGEGLAAGDCCDDAGCGCDCLHQAPADIRAADVRGIARFTMLLHGHPQAPVPGVSDTPRLRPPIA